MWFPAISTWMLIVESQLTSHSLPTDWYYTTRFHWPQVQVLYIWPHSSSEVRSAVKHYLGIGDLGRLFILHHLHQNCRIFALVESSNACTSVAASLREPLSRLYLERPLAKFEGDRSFRGSEYEANSEHSRDKLLIESSAVTTDL